MRSTTVAGLAVAIALVAAACAGEGASSTVASEDGAVPSATPDGAQDQDDSSERFSSVDTSGSAFEIAEQLSECSAEPGDHRTPGQIHLSATTNWFKLTNIDSSRNEPRTAQIAVETIDMADGLAGPNVLRLHPNTVDVASWALTQEGVEVFLPTLRDSTGDSVLMLLISLPGKDLFAAAGCGNLVNEDFRKWFGDDAATVVNALPGKIGDELVRSLRLEELEQPPGPVLLNPVDVGVEFLNNLNGVVLVLSADLDFGEVPVCARATVGWNDCLYLSDSFDLGGTSIGVYVADDGVLEFWEVSRNIDVSNPVQLLLEVQIPIAELAGDIPAVRVHFTKDGGELLAIERESEVDIESNLWAPMRPIKVD